MKAFRDGQVVDEFTGAIPPAQIEQFVARIVPSPADRLAAADDEESLRKALELEPGSAAAARKLARLLLERGEAAEALELLDGAQGDFEAEGLAARARLASEIGADGADGARPTRLSHAASPPGTRATWSKRSRASRRRSPRPTTPSGATWCAA